jgi:hypothetical protein
MIQTTFSFVIVINIYWCAYINNDIEAYTFIIVYRSGVMK